MTNTTATIAHFLGFTALLRRSGFAVAPEQSMAWLTAIELLGPSEMEDIRRAARATLAPPPERFADFDALFDAHFLGSIVPGLEEVSPATKNHCAPPRTGQSVPNLNSAMRRDESGAEATSAERLLARRFSAARTRTRCADSPARCRVVCRSGAAIAGAQRAPAQARHAADVSRCMRNAGEIVRLRRRRRRLRQRRIVVLIDVSGSMKERTQAHLAFAHALVRAADSVEVFTMGTRLTRITRPLRLKSREQALATASLLVADWDGGTRIGDALNAFLAVPRSQRSSTARCCWCSRTGSSAAIRPRWRTPLPASHGSRGGSSG